MAVDAADAEVETGLDRRIRLWVLEPNGDVVGFKGTVEEVFTQAGGRLADVVTVFLPGKSGLDIDMFQARTVEGQALSPKDAFQVSMPAGCLRIAKPNGDDVVSYSPIGWLEMHTALTDFRDAEDEAE